MKTTRREFLGSSALLLAGMEAFASRSSEKTPMIRIARLKIDPNQIEAYKVLVKEVGETSVKEEPGVLTLYSVAEKDNPTNITVFEIYADENAYKSHLDTAHFKKYKSATKNMVTSLELVEVVPITLASKR